jgi:hypothetical protein
MACSRTALLYFTLVYHNNEKHSLPYSYALCQYMPVWYTGIYRPISSTAYRLATKVVKSRTLRCSRGDVVLVEEQYGERPLGGPRYVEDSIRVILGKCAVLM